MRNHEYRGKRTSDGQWVYGSLVENSRKDEAWIIPETIMPFGAVSTPTKNFHQVCPETVGEFSGYILPEDGKKIFEGDLFTVLNDRGETVEAICEFGMARRTIMGNEVEIFCFYFRVNAYDGKKTFPIVKNYAGVHDLSMFRYVGTIHD